MRFLTRDDAHTLWSTYRIVCRALLYFRYLPRSTPSVNGSQKGISRGIKAWARTNRWRYSIRTSRLQRTRDITSSVTILKCVRMVIDKIMPQTNTPIHIYVIAAQPFWILCQQADCVARGLKTFREFSEWSATQYSSWNELQQCDWSSITREFCLGINISVRFVVWRYGPWRIISLNRNQCINFDTSSHL